MLPMRTDPALAVLSRRGVWLAEPGREAGELPPAPTGFHSFEAAIEVFAQAPVRSGSKWFRPALNVCVDDGWVRVFGETWPASIGHVDLFRKYVAARFAQRFDETPEAWQIVTPNAWPERAALCMAIPKDAIDRLTAAASAGGRRLVRLIPVSLAEFESVRVPVRGQAVFVSSAGPLRTAILSRFGRPCDAVVLPAIDAVVDLAREIFERREPGMTPGCQRIVVDASRDDVHARLLARQSIPVKQEGLQ